MFMDIPLDSIGEAGWEGQNIKREVDRGKAEHEEAEVVDQSVDWKALFANHCHAIQKFRQNKWQFLL